MSFLFIFLFLISGCKKKDESAPNIFITYPFGLPSYNVLEHVVVKADIEDNENIEWLKIDIVSSSNQRISDEVFQSGFDENQIQIEAVVFLNNIHTEGGTYYIRVRASDGTNESVDFKEILVYEIPKTLERIFLIENSIGDFNLDYLNTENEVIPGVSFSGNIAGIETNSYNQELMIASFSPTVISVIEPSELNTEQTINILDDGSEPFFLDSFIDEENRRTYFATHLGKIFVYLKNGIQALSFDITTGFRPYHIAVNDQYIIIEERSFDQSIRNISLYHKNLGAFFQSVPLSFDLVQIIPTEERILLVGNEGSEALIAEYNLSTNFINVIDSSLSGNMIVGATGTDGSEIIVISHQNSTIKYFVQNNSASSSESWNESSSRLEYNPVSGAVYGISTDGLFRLQTSGNIFYYPETAGYDDFELMYNK